MKFYGHLFFCIFLFSFLLCIPVANAYTFDKMVTYCNKIVNNEISTNTQVRNNAQKFLTCSNQIRNSIGEANIGNYDNFIIASGSTYTYFTAVSGTANMVHYSGYTNFTASGFNNSWNCYISSSGISNTGYKTVTGQAYVNAFSTYWDESLGLVNGTIPNHNGYFNLISDSTPFEFSLKNDSTLNGYGQYQQTIYSYNYNYSVENWLIGQVDEFGDEYSRIRFYLYGANQDYELTYNIRTETYTNVKNMWFNSTENKLYFKNLYLYYDNVYSFLIYLMDDDNFVHDSIEYELIFFPYGTIIENGEVSTMGSGEYSIQNATGQIVSSITSGDQAIINQIASGDREAQIRDNWWKDQYNNLFNVDSGDIEEIKGMIERYIPSGDSPLSVFDTLFGSLNNEPSDFIIRWDNIGLNLTTNGGQSRYSGDFIYANSVNFSKLTRDNQTFGVVHLWIRVFAVISFGFMFLYSLYRCILDILGVTNRDMFDEDEEHRQIGFINDWRDKK